MDPTGVKVLVKFCDSRSNRSQGIRLPHFVTNDNDDAGRRTQISGKQFDLESTNFTWTSILTATPDMTSPATSGRHLSQLDKRAEDAASDGFGWNFIGAAFCLAQPIGGLLV